MALTLLGATQSGMSNTHHLLDLLRPFYAISMTSDLVPSPHIRLCLLLRGVTQVWGCKKSCCWGQSQISPRKYSHNILFFLFLVIYYLNKLQKCNYWQKSRRCTSSVFFSIDPSKCFVILYEPFNGGEKCNRQKQLIEINADLFYSFKVDTFSAKCYCAAILRL